MNKPTQTELDALLLPLAQMTLDRLKADWQGTDIVKQMQAEEKIANFLRNTNMTDQDGFPPEIGPHSLRFVRKHATN
tara:strand:- start:19921 stop:20151 length:231 start_codon:yes stop_codon:yes gene_type:complete